MTDTSLYRDGKGELTVRLHLSDPSRDIIYQSLLIAGEVEAARAFEKPADNRIGTRYYLSPHGVGVTLEAVRKTKHLFENMWHEWLEQDLAAMNKRLELIPEARP